MSSDNIFQEVKLYIEGVQTPYFSINIDQAYGRMPSASISIPPQSGLMDITKFYYPKVHVFFSERDSTTGVVTERVLFMGLLTNPNYSKSKEGNGNISISFQCKHTHEVMRDIILDYCGAIREGDIGGPEGSQIYLNRMNSQASIQAALTGWTEQSSGLDNDYPALSNDANPNKGRSDILPFALRPYANRLKGMPGIVINLWNQLSSAAYEPGIKPFQNTFYKMYKPLIEEGLLFFKRMSGHMLIEEDINSSNNRQVPCEGAAPIMVPPSSTLFLKSSMQTGVTLQNLQSHLDNSNEITNLYAVLEMYYSALEYDLLTLSCPAEVPKDPLLKTTTHTSADLSKNTYAVDTIVKPTMPFYFSPSCNVVYPNMYSSLNVMYEDDVMPTRIDVRNRVSQEEVFHLHFRTPSSIREAIAYKKSPTKLDLANTTSSSSGAIGKYEMGRGVKVETSDTPNWLAHLIDSEGKKGTPSPGHEADPAGTPNDAAITSLKEGWATRYGNAPDMNPWDSRNTIPPYQRILFSTADYYYTKRFAATKAGTISGVFNPYIIPGYPMDVLEANPNLPSFHALCTSVSHTITANSIGTSISFTAAMTYSELATYYVPFITPYLQVTLGLAANPTLVGVDTKAATKANDFYKNVLGVEATIPENIFDFSTGFLKTDSTKISTEDTIRIKCKRPIESRADLASRFGLTFIDLTATNYNATGVLYIDPSIASGVDTRLEIGASQFLDYSQDAFEKINS